MRHSTSSVLANAPVGADGPSSERRRQPDIADLQIQLGDSQELQHQAGAWASALALVVTGHRRGHVYSLGQNFLWTLPAAAHTIREIRAR